MIFDHHPLTVWSSAFCHILGVFLPAVTQLTISYGFPCHTILLFSGNTHMGVILDGQQRRWRRLWFFPVTSRVFALGAIFANYSHCSPQISELWRSQPSQKSDICLYLMSTNSHHHSTSIPLTRCLDVSILGGYFTSQFLLVWKYPPRVNPTCDMAVHKYYRQCIQYVINGLTTSSWSPTRSTSTTGGYFSFIPLFYHPLKYSLQGAIYDTSFYSHII